METRVTLNGIHSFSDALVQAVLDYKYGRNKDKTVLHKRFEEDVKNLLEFQEKLGITPVHTGSMAFEDILRPFTVFLDSFHSFKDIGELPIRRWSTTNYFYREPTLIQSLPDEPQVIRESRNTLFDIKYFQVDSITNLCRVQIPGITTFAWMTNFKTALRDGVYAGIQSYYEAIGEYLGKEIATLPKSCKEVQIDDPMLLWKELPRTHYESIRRGYESLKEQNRDRDLIVVTYFANAMKHLRFLLELPVEGIGVDLWYTNVFHLMKHDFSGKILQAGLLNTKNFLPAAEGKRERLQEFWKHVSQGLLEARMEELVIAPNTGLHYLPRSEADDMFSMLVEAFQGSEEEA